MSFGKNLIFVEKILIFCISISMKQWQLIQSQSRILLGTNIVVISTAIVHLLLGTIYARIAWTLDK